ncbi:MAG: hypothetical protein PHW76_08730 [Alphaproteobacteria bacterium]|nr:hypothetical protein [Alphaproteobacteria bacterium]
MPRPIVPQQPKAPPVVIDPVVSSLLPSVSSETVGLKDSEGFGADMWKGTNRAVAERLLSMVAPTGSPVLNGLVLRLLRTSAVPPEGDNSSSRLTSARVEKLALFGDTAGAWRLARQADSKFVDGAAFLAAAEKAYLAGDESVCAKVSEYPKNHPGANWQNFTIVCRLRAKDQKAAQVALDILRSEENHDSVFVHIADRNILGGAKTLPQPLSPLTLESIGLLQLANLPVPDAVFARNDAGARALMRLPAQKDATRLAFAERAAERGLIAPMELADAYRASVFSVEAVASAQSSNETGARLRALLFKAAEAQADPDAKFALAARFVQSSSASFLNGAGGVVAAMLGDFEITSAMAKNAAALAHIYMLAESPMARDWFDLAKVSSPLCDNEIQALWPQFALAGLETEGAYAAGFSKWFASAVKNADEATLRDMIAPTLLVFEAAGLNVPNAAWDRVIAAAHTEKKMSISPLLFERMLAAAASSKHAETVLMAAIVAGNGEPSLTKSLGIISSLREAGHEKEAATFARHAVATFYKDR